ncbi:MAG: transcription termination factor Rho [Candidatus Didemnitutus sp.]|jgi:transcription termination factor Rho|nr:transcription termination factor Rho [Candidatus Didemnitutus sp.]
MALPPKSDEDTASTASKADSADASKKRPRARSRLYRSKSKAAAEATGELLPSAEPAPAPKAEAPAERPARSARAAKTEAPVATRAEEPRREEPARADPRREESRRSEPAAAAPAPEAPAQSAAPSPEPASAPAPAPSAPAPSAQGGDAGGDYAQSSGGDGGGYDSQQQQGGGKFNRWRDKKFRGKWNKHGGGGGGGGGQGGGNGGQPKHPPQPPPPKGEIYFGELPDPARFNDLEALAKTADEISSQQAAEPIWLKSLYALGHADLSAKARSLGAKFEGVPNRKQLLAAVFAAAAEQKIPLLDEGWLDLTDRGFGFVVHDFTNYRLFPENAYLPELFIRKLGLKRGHRVEVQVQAPQGNDRCPSVVRIRSVMGSAPDGISSVKPFEELTPYYPLKRIWLESQGAKDVSMRMVDIITPVGFGQRGLIVAPPRTGKTVLLQNIANSIAANSPEAKLIILLIDERPEEVTDFRRHCKGEVVSSTFDETPESHVHCAEMVIEKARRLVELGDHVVILLDSITRLARAYNALASNSGKIMSGGLEATALQKPKRFFGSARNIEGAGSLTILGTALVDTGSRMDEIIFEEFKGTGNMELHLDRDLVNKRIFPALNIDKSGTRKEELIYHPDELARIYALRRAMQGVPAADSIEMLIQRLKKTKTNAEFLLSLNR